MTIIETSTLEDLKDQLDSQTLLVLDLDNTLVESTTYYGSYQWGHALIQRALSQGASITEALDVIIPRWDIVQRHIDLKLVEPTAHLCLQAYSQICQMIGLTGRSPDLALHTIDCLKTHCVEFGGWNHQVEFDLPHDATFQSGIAFVGSKNDKGKALIQFLNQVSPFEKVVFVDDQISYLEQAQEALSYHEAEYIGVLYKGVKELQK